MRVIKFILSIIIIVISIVGLYRFSTYLISNQEENEEQSEQKSQKENEEDKPLHTGLDYALDYIGESVIKAKEHLGNPMREDKTSYGYTWFIYNNDTDGYIQLGVQNNEVVTVFTIGDMKNIQSIGRSTSYQELDNELGFKEKVTLKKDNSLYKFELTKQDLQSRPLIKLDEDTYLQLYFDTKTNDLVALRIMTATILLKHQPYKVVYQGKLDNQQQLDEKSWGEIDESAEKQVFDITNVIRNLYGKKTLEWDETVSKVAYSHSKDMERNNYFAHQDLNGLGLKERLEINDISYLSAGENIAAKYTDGPAAVIGWLNSQGHRKALLNETFTHLGVGVYRSNYTQNFIQKP